MVHLSTPVLLITRCDLGSLADVASAVLAANGGGTQPLTGILLDVRCDLGSLADVNDAVRTTTAGGARPLTGVVHAGGVLEDAALRNQTAAHVRHVFAPKLSAAMGLAQVCVALTHDPISRKALTGLPQYSPQQTGRSQCSPGKPLLHVLHDRSFQTL